MARRKSGCDDVSHHDRVSCTSRVSSRLRGLRHASRASLCKRTLDAGLQKVVPFLRNKIVDWGTAVNCYGGGIAGRSQLLGRGRPGVRRACRRGWFDRQGQPARQRLAHRAQRHLPGRESPPPPARPPACLPACLVGRQLPSLPCRCTHHVGTSPLPQLDMLPMGQIRCQGAATVQHPACNCDNW